MLASSTHDTKRSEDVRARLSVLSEIPGEWRRAVTEWSKLNECLRPANHGCHDANTEYLIYQTLVGAWPIDSERMLAYIQKAMREAKRKTSWLSPNESFEKSVQAFIEGLYSNAEFLDSLERFVAKITYPGWINSLSGTLLKLMSPGVPDTYQGTELWDLSLVDPDNRRPVNYELRRKLLHEVKGMTATDVMKRMQDGLAKLWTIWHGLSTRRKYRECFEGGCTYRPISAQGTHAACVVAFARGERVAVVGRRLPMKTCRGWADTSIKLPKGTWQNVLAGTTVAGQEVMPGDLFATFPVALLIRN
jgi:(1->4)-alpha-D-glucan 1-alpha-D-glucosylmutase